MKRALLFLAFLVLIISCRDDNNDPQSLLIGTWKITEYGSISKTDSIMYTREVIDCFEKQSLTFNNNNKYERIYFKDNFIGSCVPSDISKGEYNYNVDKKTITFTPELINNYHPIPYNLKIHSISNTELIIINQEFDNWAIIAIYKK